jgi:hypothetical protein
MKKEEQNNNDMNKILWISNNLQCKLIESCYNSISKKCICPKEEPKQVTEQMNVGGGSGSLLSDAEISKYAKKYDVEDINDAINRMGGFIVGAKWSRDTLIVEIERRQQLIMSEPDGIVRETMIANLLVGLQ